MDSVTRRFTEIDKYIILHSFNNLSMRSKPVETVASKSSRDNIRKKRWERPDCKRMPVFACSMCFYCWFVQSGCAWGSNGKHININVTIPFLSHSTRSARSPWLSCLTLEPAARSSTWPAMTSSSSKPCSTRRQSFCRNFCQAITWWVPIISQSFYSFFHFTEVSWLSSSPLSS